MHVHPENLPTEETTQQDIHFSEIVCSPEFPEGCKEPAEDN